MKQHIGIIAVTALLQSIAAAGGVFPVTATVNAGSVLYSNACNPVGINVNLLEDNDSAWGATRVTPTSNALKTLRSKFLRYPGGNKSDHIRWSTAPFTNAVPRPMMASVWPGNDTVYSSGTTFRTATLGFDDFITMCRSVGAEPTIVVAFDSMRELNAGSTAYPAKAELIDIATNWVRYANITKNYGVKYWAIGNESYLSGATTAGRVPVTVYASNMRDFSQAMKRIDPSIHIGANSDPAGVAAIMTIAGSNIDYIDHHDYPAYGWSIDTYRAKTYIIDPVSVIAAQIQASAAAQTDKDRMKVHVSETGPIAWTGGWDYNDAIRGIFTFDLLGSIIRGGGTRLACIEIWNTHWRANGKDCDPTGLLLNHDNTFSAVAKAAMLWGAMLPVMVPVSGGDTNVRVYASKSPDGSNLIIGAVNKSAGVQALSLTVNGFTGVKDGTTTVYLGGTYNNTNPVLSSAGTCAIAGLSLTDNLAPYSITLYCFTNDAGAPVVHASPPVISGIPADMTTNRAFTVTLGVDKDYGYWSTNGSAYRQFTTAATNITIGRTTTLRCFGSNSSGVSATNVRTYTFDTTAPAVTGAPYSLSTNRAFTVTLSVNEDHGYCSVNGGPFLPFATPGTNVVIGRTTTLMFFGRDMLGNTGITNVRNYTVEIVTDFNATRHMKHEDGLLFINIPPDTGGSVYTVSGRRIAVLTAGAQGLFWDARTQDGRRAAPGIYLCRLSSPSAVSTVKVMLR